MLIPGWLYERLPLVYAVGGVASFYLLGVEGPGALSGPLLIAAGVLTALRRHNHRAKSAARRRTGVRSQTPAAGGASRSTQRRPVTLGERELSARRPPGART
jgi:hypothetical protein